MSKNNDLLNLKEAAIWLKKSETTVYRLVTNKKLKCYGGHHEHKLFSITHHLIPYLESIETEVKMPEVEKPKRNSSGRAGRTYQYKTNLFADLYKN